MSFKEWELGLNSNPATSIFNEILKKVPLPDDPDDFLYILYIYSLYILYILYILCLFIYNKYIYLYFICSIYRITGQGNAR